MTVESQIKERGIPRPPAVPAAEGSPLPARSKLKTQNSKLLAAAVASGGLLWLCHFPVACGWLAWVALVPLLCLVRAQTTRWRIFLFAWLGGLVFFVPVLQWMRVADDRMYITWIALALYCALYMPAAIGLVRWFDRRTRLPLVLAVPLVWTALELFRARFLGGFAWYFLGHSQHTVLPLVQIADLGGVYAVTFLVAAVNALLFEGLCTWSAFRCFFGFAAEHRPQRWPVLLGQSAMVALLMGASLLYGFWRLGQDSTTPGPRISLVQGSVEQRIRNDNSGGNVDAGKQMFDHYAVLSHLAASQEPPPDLVVWPETCFPDDWVEISPDLPLDKVDVKWRRWAEESRIMASNAPKFWPTNVLLGLNTQVLGADLRARRYNSSVLIRKDGQPAGRYDKMHLVPFGEYVPLRDWVPWMNKLAPYDFDYSVTPGEQQTRFTLGDYRFGMVICYEDTDPYLARQYLYPGSGEAPVDFLVNTSNDGWFDGTSEHDEHLAVARFRAIECRRALLRAVNMGISAVIDSNGRVLEPRTVATYQVGEQEIPLWEVAEDAGDLPLRRWEEFKKRPGVLTAVIPIDHRASLYAAWGDWLPWTCWLGLGLGLVVSMVRRSNRRLS